jgi:membrane protease YdiL (CAAX protease family)
MPTPHASREPFAALLLVATAWSLLASQALLAPHLGRPAAVFACFAAVTLLVAATRRRAQDRTLARATGLTALASLAGFASYPIWIAAIGSAGRALGLRATPPPAPPEHLLLVVSVLGLAPVFEELLYRERLLPALRARLGAVPALLLSSLLFALPHLEPWAMLATGLVGLGLGGLLLATGSVAPCIGLHAGLNLAAIVCGIPPRRLVLPLPLALPAGVLLVAAALLAARPGRLARHPLERH